MQSRIRAAALASMLLLSGCAGVTPHSFYSNPSAASAFEMCKSLGEPSTDMDFANALRMELGRRGVAESSCPDVIKQRETAVAVGVVAGVVALVAIVNRHSDHGHTSVDVGVGTTIYAGGQSPSTVDAEWDWDQFTNTDGQLVWACRGVQTGQVADQARCAGRPLADVRWPGK